MVFTYAGLSMLISYLLGSIPTAFIFGKVLKDIDIRDYGSGNIGATNALRALGKGPALAVFVIDFLKGFISVTLVPYFVNGFFAVPSEQGYFVPVLCGASSVVGHVWTVFLNFKGGKGIATSAGVILGLSPVIMIVLIIVWATVFAVWRYVSLASISAAVALPLASVFLNKDFYFVVFCSVLSVLSVFTHRSNIRRLIKGEEKKIL